MARSGENTGSLLGLVQRRLVAHYWANLQTGHEAHNRHAAIQFTELGVAQPALREIPASSLYENAMHIDQAIGAGLQIAIETGVLVKRE